MENLPDYKLFACFVFFCKVILKSCEKRSNQCKWVMRHGLDLDLRSTRWRHLVCVLKVRVQPRNRLTAGRRNMDKHDNRVGTSSSSMFKEVFFFLTSHHAMGVFWQTRYLQIQIDWLKPAGRNSESRYFQHVKAPSGSTGLWPSINIYVVLDLEQSRTILDCSQEILTYFKLSSPSRSWRRNTFCFQRTPHVMTSLSVWAWLFLMLFFMATRKPNQTKASLKSKVDPVYLQKATSHTGILSLYRPWSQRTDKTTCAAKLRHIFKH